METENYSINPSEVNETQNDQAPSEIILLVDDTLANLKLVSNFLIKAGFEVLVAKSGKQALKILEKASPDLILLDVVMPEIDGFELCRCLKNWEKTKDIPVIFMTALADTSNSAYKVKGLTLGAVDYISKPIQLEEVLARVQIHLKLRSLTKQLSEHNVHLQQEIAARQQAEREINRTKNLLQSIFNESADAIFLVNSKTGLIVECNRRAVELFEATCKDELLNIEGQTLQKELFTPEELSAILHEVECYGFWSRELEYITKRGKLFWGNIAVKQIQVAGQTMNLVRVTDITKRKQAEEALRQSTQREQEKAIQLQHTLDELKRTQVQLIQTEKMSSLGRLVAGIAHEINNPVSFIYGNLVLARQYFQNLTHLIEVYQQTYPDATPELESLTAEMDWEFLVDDWSKLVDSMQVGAERIHEIVRSLKNFSRLDETELKSVDIHEGIDNTLLILQPRLRAEGNRPEIMVIKDYTQLLPVTCYASQLNQVFFHLLNNAIDALESQPPPRVITIDTLVITKNSPSPLSQPSPSQFAVVKIADNGSGMSKDVRQKIFDPFFTTKSVGYGTGLGLSICYQIVVEKHQGQIYCFSALGQGTEMIVEIPIKATGI